MHDLRVLVTTIIKLLILSSLIAASTVLSCGPLPSGQAALQLSYTPIRALTERILRFTVSGIKLALPMVFTADVASRSVFPNVSASGTKAEAFVRNLVMIAMNDVLEQQGRNAALSYEVISVILSQLNLNVTYTPLNCFSVSILAAGQPNPRMNAMVNCLVSGDMVTSTCDKMGMQDCAMPMNMKEISQQHSSITGTLRVGNLIMATWSDQMWRTILSRVLRALSTGSFGTSFQSATVNIA